MNETMQRDAVVAKRGAVTLMALALVEGTLAFVIPANNLLFLMLTGAKPHEEEGEYLSVYEQYAGLQPFPVPWWAFLVVAVALAVLLFVTRKPERQYLPTMHGKILLQNHPYFLAFWALLLCLMSFSGGPLYLIDGWGLYWIPGLAALAVFAAAVTVGIRQRRGRFTRRKRMRRNAS